MKKILILFSIFILTISSAFALSKPRWENRPIKVYIPGSSYTSRIMKNAFLQWQSRTNSAVWFTFLSDDKKNDADISVIFVESNTNCGNSAAIGCTVSQTKDNGFYSHNDIYIAYKYVHELVGDDGTVARKTYAISAPQMYRVMLHEIGHAIGINQHSNKPNSVMYTYSLNEEHIPQRLTDDDLNFVYNVYR